MFWDEKRWKYPNSSFLWWQQMCKFYVFRNTSVLCIEKQAYVSLTRNGQILLSDPIHNLIMIYNHKVGFFFFMCLGKFSTKPGTLAAGCSAGLQGIPCLSEGCANAEMILCNRVRTCTLSLGWTWIARRFPVAVPWSRFSSVMSEIIWFELLVTTTTMPLVMWQPGRTVKLGLNLVSHF